MVTRFSICFILCLSCVLPLKATHLVGGHMGYEFLGVNSSGEHEYEITVEMYRDCFNSDVPFDSEIWIGVYEDDSPYDLLKEFNMQLGPESSIDPPFAGDSDCDFDPDVCIQRGIYQETIALPSSVHGYHLLHRRCCRNVTVNLTEQMGQGYYTKIPPTSYRHSSPEFEHVPTPFICRDVLSKLENTAVDPDGDSLSYHFYRPFRGGNQDNPAPAPSLRLNYPVEQVFYTGSHTPAQPFGNAGTANIFASSGQTQVRAPQVGNYVVGVEVRSYRNDNHIGSVYRDLQIIVIDCPDNSVPELVGPGNPVQRVHEVRAGDHISFDISVADTGHLLHFTAHGEVLGDQGNVREPHGELFDAVDEDTVISTFSWQTECYHASEEPYLFTIETTDDGCPPQTLLDNFQIKVNPVPVPDEIKGPDIPCQYGETFENYYVHKGEADNTSFWDVEGGTIVDQPSDTSVNIQWEAETGTITYWEVNPFGCKGEEVTKEVEVVHFPEEVSMPFRQFCADEPEMLGPEDPLEGYEYQWEPASYVKDPNAQNTLSDFSGASFDEPTAVTLELTISSLGCTLREEQSVLVYPELDRSPVSGPDEVCAGDRYSYMFSPANPEDNVNYYWSVDDGSVLNDFNDSIEVYFPDGGIHFVRLSGESQYGCTSDTTALPVEVTDYTIDSIKGPPVVCPNNPGISYEVDPAEGASYYWGAEGGTVASGQGDPMVYIDWDGPGDAEVWVVEELENGCLSDTLRLPVLLDYNLQTSDIQGPESVCVNAESVVYEVFETENSEYDWEIENGTILSGQGTHRVEVEWDEPGNGQLRVFETSHDPVNDRICEGEWIEINVQLIDAPDPHELPDPVVECQYETFMLGDPEDGSNQYTWNIEGADEELDSGNHVYLTYEAVGSYELSVFKTNEFGCNSDTTEVLVDIKPEPATSEIQGDTIICDPENYEQSYYVEGFEHSEYNWSIENGEIAEDNNDQIIVVWEGPGQGRLSVTEVSEFGCRGPEVTQDIYIDMPRPELNVVSTLEDDDAVIKIDWGVENDMFFDSYMYLYKRERNDYNWTLADSFSYASLEAHDSEVRTHLNAYNYKVALKDLCGNRHETSAHRSILLQGEKDENGEVDLEWSPYIGWGSALDGYILYRKVDEAEEYSIVNSGIDTSLSMLAEEDGYRHCYRVLAEHENSSDLESWSNEVCFEFEPIIYVPNAFSPNDGKVNNTFHASVLNVKEYRMTIYNRWGQKLFETEDEEEAWDGTFRGEDVPEGAYLYKITYEGVNGKGSRSGTLTLLR